VAAYLPLVARVDLIDFKVATDDGIAPPETLLPGLDNGQCPKALDRFVGNWVAHIERDDDVFRRADAQTAPIVRRAWIVAFDARFLRRGVTVLSGHQLLVVAEKRRERPADVVVRIVDNVRGERYRDAVHGWLEGSLRAHFASILPALRLGEVAVIGNRMPTSGTLGSCMSASFRAVMLFSFLHDPLPRLREPGEEGQRFLKLMYLHLARMRHCLLALWGVGERKEIVLTFEPTRWAALHSLHNVDGVALYLASRALTREGHELREYIRLLGGALEGSPDHAAAKHLTRLHFNRDLDAQLAEVFQREKRNGPCVVCARFAP
jgi:hypothetical protein